MRGGKLRMSLCLAIALMTHGVLASALGKQRRAASSDRLQAPAGERPTVIDPAGETVLPNGRLITPRGRQITVAPHPFGLALSRDGKVLVTVNSGTNPFSISLISGFDGTSPNVQQIPPGFKLPDADPESVYMGVAIAPDGKTVYVAEGNNGRVGIFDIASHHRVGAINLDGDFGGTNYANSLTGDMQLSPDGRYLYVLDVAHFRLVILDADARRIVSSISVGRLPFALSLSPDGRRVYVSNVGTFSYSLVPGYDADSPRHTGLDFPPYGYPSTAAEQGVQIGSRRIPGLGDPNLSESNSIWTIDVSNPSAPRVTAKIRTGLPVGSGSVSGSSPGGVVAGRDRIYVSNSAQDSITEVDARSGRVKKTLGLEPAAAVKGLRGVLPFGLALSPDEKRLYVACAGINGVAVINVPKLKVLGYIPAAWFPARVRVSQDGKTLFVANAKGFGAGANGGPDFRPGPEGTYIGDITKGAVSIIPVPDAATLKMDTEQVLKNNGFLPTAGVVGPATSPQVSLQRIGAPQPKDPSPGSLRSPPSPLGEGREFNRHPLPWGEGARGTRAGEGSFSEAAQRSSGLVANDGPAGSRIHHIVFIVKENRTFDQVFGDISEARGARVNAEPSLAEYGEDATVRLEDVRGGAQTRIPATVPHVNVTPNHHALARQFTFSDNFYADSDVSVDGHHWLVGNYPNEVVELGWPAGYGGKLDFKPDAAAPGRLEIGGSSPWPESYLEAGSLWEHLARHGISFRNYGEGFELPGQDEGTGELPTGIREVVNVPMPEVLFENTSRTYPTFNTNISDQYRWRQFQQEFQTRYASGKEPLPQFIYIWLPNDHTADRRPADGFPYRASYVADNDLALGKLVELFSHSPFWQDMAIFVTEDDAQGGVDHVDAHRTLLMVISPYARRGVSHVHASFTSILKTVDLIFGLPPLNQYDAAASDLSDCFTDQPDFTPYQTLPPDTRIFDPRAVKEPGEDLQTGGVRPSEPMDDPATIRKEHRQRLQGEEQPQKSKSDRPGTSDE